MGICFNQMIDDKHSLSATRRAIDSRLAGIPATTS